MATYYETLGVDPSADATVVRRAYRKLARRFHPDVNSEPDSTDTMARINEAYRTLIDPGRRNEYDAMLRAGLAHTGIDLRRRERSPLSVRLQHRLGVLRTPIYALSFAPDTGTLVSSSFDNEVLWWDPGTGEQLRRVKLDSGAISAVRALSEERLVAAGAAESQISVCRMRDGVVDSWRSSPAEWASCLALSWDGRRIATGTVHRTLVVGKTDLGGIEYEVEDHCASITAVAWSHDGRYLATGSADATVRLRDSSSGKTLHIFRQILSTVTAIAIAPNNGFLAVAAADLSVRVFSLNDGALKRVYSGHTKPIECLAFHPNGWLFASGGRDGNVGLWNAAEGIGQVHLEASIRPILAVAFSVDGTKLASAGLDRTVRLWDLRVKS